VLLLCQPDDRKGCAWCCGLYNVRDSGRGELACRLRRRTERFYFTSRTVEGVLRYAEETRDEERLALVDPDFYSCEFVGFLNRDETRVGCLLNPQSPGNRGVDWRGLSFHGGAACSGFFCRASRELTDGERRIIIGTVDDWYLYGFLLSDIDYIKSVFRFVEESLGRPLEPEWADQPDARGVLLEFFRWKFEPSVPEEMGSRAVDDPGLDFGVARAAATCAPNLRAHLDRVLDRVGCSSQSPGSRQRNLDLLTRILARLLEPRRRAGL
jgi:hypothetical protein